MRARDKLARMARDSFHDSLWAATSAPASPAPPLEGEARADVAIVGAGFMGLSLALHLAERGVAVALLEAREAGFGASGRNTGFVVPSFSTALGPRAVMRRLGVETGERLSRMIGGAGEFVWALIRRHAIDCAAEPTGWLQPAHAPAKIAFLAERRDEWAALGKTLTLLRREETRAATGIDSFHGALLDPTGGQIDPLAFARGLARAAMAAGARIHAESPVVSLARAGADWVAATPRGRLRAPIVYLATNAMVGALHRALARSLIPVTVHQIATQILDDDMRRVILPSRQPLSDTRRHTLALRWSADHRLLTGGIAAINHPGANARMATAFARRIDRMTRRPGLARAEYRWTGTIAVTPDMLPRLFELGAGLYGVLGCNGRGITMATALGEALARFAIGGRAAELPLPVSRPAPIPAHTLARLGPSLWLPWSRLRDRLEGGG